MSETQTLAEHCCCSSKRGKGVVFWKWQK